MMLHSQALSLCHNDLSDLTKQPDATLEEYRVAAGFAVTRLHKAIAQAVELEAACDKLILANTDTLRIIATDQQRITDLQQRVTSLLDAMRKRELVIVGNHDEIDRLEARLMSAQSAGGDVVRGPWKGASQ